MDRVSVRIEEVDHAGIAIAAKSQKIGIAELPRDAAYDPEMRASVRVIHVDE